jgi:protein O-GlcNAc transferase
MRIEGPLMKSRTALGQGKVAEARAAPDQALARRHDDLQTLRERSQFLFDNGSPDESEQALRALIERAPDDGSAHHHLDTLLLRAQQYEEAVQEYHQSLRYRPNYAATYLNLGYALKDSGRIDEAARAWEQVMRLAPNDETAREELARLGRAVALVGR